MGRYEWNDLPEGQSDEIQRLIDTAVADALDSSGEVFSVVNSSGTATNIGTGQAAIPAGLTVTVAPHDFEIRLHARVVLTQNAAGTGSVNCSLVDLTSQATLDAEYAPLPGAGEPFTVRAEGALAPANVEHQVGVLIGCNPNASQTPTVSALNSATSPSRFRGTRT